MAQSAGERRAPRRLTGESVEFDLVTTRGVRRTTGALRGQAVLVFFESATTTTEHAALHARLRRELAACPAYAQRIALVAVAQLGPSRNPALVAATRAMATAVAGQMNLEFWLDEGNRVTAALDLPPDRSAVLLLDARGVCRWGWTGVLPPAALEDLFARLLFEAEGGAP